MSLAAGALLAASAAVADPAPAQSGAPAAGQQGAGKPDPADRVICHQEEATGTRLGGHRVCHTKREWDQIAHDAQDGVNSAQRNVSGGSPR